MRQNADGTWTVVRRVTYTARTPGIMFDALAAAPRMGRSALCPDSMVVVEDITEPSLPVEMPEPMPGMIAEYATDWGVLRIQLTWVSATTENGFYVSAGPGRRPPLWAPENYLKVYSALGDLLWKRPTEPSPT